MHVQHPCQPTVKFGIDGLEIRKRDLLLQDHLVETDDEVCVEEATVEDTETETATNELEVVQMLRVDP